MHTNSTYHEPAFRRALPWLLCITGVFALNFLGRAILSPLMPLMERDLGISHAQAGGLFLLVSLGYGGALLASGFLSSRLKHRHCVTLSALWMGFSLLGVGYATSSWGLQLALLCFGISSGIYFPSGMAAVTSLVAPKDYGKAISVHELAPNLSLFLAPLLAELLLRGTDWRGIMTILGYAGLASALFFGIWGKGGDFKGKTPNFSMLGRTVRMPLFWLLGLLFCFAVGASIGPYSMLPLFLVDERGYNPDRANTLLALSRMLSPLAAIAAGICTDKLGAVRTTGLYLVLAGVGTLLLGLTHGLGLTAVVMVQPLASVLFFPAGFAIISRVFPADERNVVISLVIPMGVLGGMGLIPILLGVCGDMGRFGLGFVLQGGFMLLALPVLPLLRRAMDEK